MLRRSRAPASPRASISAATASASLLAIGSIFACFLMADFAAISSAHITQGVSSSFSSALFRACSSCAISTPRISARYVSLRPRIFSISSSGSTQALSPWSLIRAQLKAPMSAPRSRSDLL